MEGQLEFFSQQLCPHSLAASQACAAAPAATEPDKQCQVMLSMLCSYKLPRLNSAKPANTEREESAMEQGNNSQASRQDDWAPGAPWDRFANHGDPVGVQLSCAASMHALTTNKGPLSLGAQRLFSEADLAKKILLRYLAVYCHVSKDCCLLHKQQRPGLWDASRQVSKSSCCEDMHTAGANSLVRTSTTNRLV